MATKAVLGNPSLQYGMQNAAKYKADIKACQKLLADAGFNPGAVDGIFGLGTQAAVMAFQRSEGLLADGVIGPRTAAALQGRKKAPLLPSVAVDITVPMVSQMFPHTAVSSIKRNLPFVLAALKGAGIGDRLMVLAALATIRAETEGFEPISEGISRYNTSPDPKGHPFDLYDNRKDLGNQGAPGNKPDGESFRGRGFIQLTGRANYGKYGKEIGEDLLGKPGRANDPDIAAKILAAFLKDQERPIKEALLDRDFARARRCVNGGVHGLDRFTDAYLTGARLTA